MKKGEKMMKCLFCGAVWCKGSRPFKGNGCLACYKDRKPKLAQKPNSQEKE